MIKLICIKNNEKYDITDTIISITWGGDINSCSRKLELSLMNKLDIPLASLIIFLVDNKEIFRGFVFDRRSQSPNTKVDYVVYDYAEKLNKIKAAYNFKNKTAAAITKTILNEYSFKIGNLAAANKNIKKIFTGETLFDIIQTAYTQESVTSGKKYMILAEKDTINVVEKGIVSLDITFELGKNIINASTSESISNLVNKVIILDENGNQISFVQDDKLLKQFGLFQDVYNITEGENMLTSAKSMLKGIEQTMDISGYGDITCITGRKVRIKDTSIGLVGTYYIDADTHTWQGGKYTVDLTLNLINIMSEKNTGQDEKQEVNK